MYSATMYSDLGLFSQYLTYMYRRRSFNSISTHITYHQPRCYFNEVINGCVAWLSIYTGTRTGQLSNVITTVHKYSYILSSKFWHCSHSMGSRDYERCWASVCPSVCPIIWLPHAAAAGLLLWAQRAGDTDWLWHSWHTNSNCEQCHIVSWRRKLDLLPISCYYSMPCALALCPCVCHKLVFHQNGWKHRAGFWHRGFPFLWLHCI